MKSGTAPPLTRQKYRADVDGLRAIAVLAVIGFHAFPAWLRGGFVGVDIFFVISGYLISTIIFKNLEHDGGFSFAEFYARRIKRIFPALLLVLGSVYAFAWFALLPDEFKQLGKHIATGAGFVSNLAFWQEAGYFDNAADTKPLLHLWSLGIEEQFYIVWPLTLYLAWRRRIGLLAVCLVVGVASFVLNVAGVHNYSVATFYSPAARIWELIAGALVAYAALHRPAQSSSGASTLQNGQSLIGIGLIACAVTLIDKTRAFPGWWALLPVVGASLIIRSGPAAWLNRKVLAQPALVWVGLISFPLYLWHWPLLSLARIVESAPPSAGLRLGVIGASFLLAWLSYMLLEKPIRFGAHSKPKVLALCVCAALLALLGYATYSRAGLAFRLKGFDPAVGQFEAPRFEAERQLCHQKYPSYQGSCILRPGTPQGQGRAFILLGDSHSEALAAGFIARHPEHTVTSFATGGCLAFIGVERFTEDGAQGCTQLLDPALAYLASNPDNATVILTDRFAAYISGTGFGELENSALVPGHLHIQAPGPRTPHKDGSYDAIFASGLRQTLGFLKQHNRPTVFVHQAPELGFDPRVCVKRPLRFAAQNCQVPRQQVEQRQAAYRAAANAVLADFPQVTVLDPLPLLCDKELCYATKNQTLLYRDSDHLNPLGAGLLAAGIATSLRSFP